MAFSVVDTLRRFETHLTTIGSSLNANMSRVIVARNIADFCSQATQRTVQSGAELSVSVLADGGFSITYSGVSIANGVLICWETNNGEKQSKDVIDVATRLLGSRRNEFTINVLDPFPTYDDSQGSHSVQRVHITGRDSILYKDTDIWIGNIEKWL